MTPVITRIPSASRQSNIKVSALRWLPIILIQVFLTFVLFAYRYGPWKYPTQADERVVWLALLYQLSLLIGYAVANYSFVIPSAKRFSWQNFLSLSLLINILMYFPTSYARTGSPIPNVLLGLTNPGEAYSQSLDAAQTGVSASIEYLRILLGPLLYAYLPLSVFFWREISNRKRVVAAMMVLATIALYISMGTNKAIGEFAVIIPFLAFSSFLLSSYRVSLRRRLIFLTLAVALFAGFFSFFTSAMKDRSGSGISVGYFPPGNTRADFQNPMLTALPMEMRPGVLGLLGYATQGYFAIGLALDEPFDPMYGLGSSTFMSRQVTKLLKSPSFEDRSYPAKIEKYGWDRYIYWSSIYLWIASDLSFYGVPIFCFLAGFLLLYSWRDTLEHKSPFGVIMLALNITMFFYFTSNNQIGQSGELLTAYFATLAIWLLYRSRINLTFPGGFSL